MRVKAEREVQRPTPGVFNDCGSGGALAGCNSGSSGSSGPQLNDQTLVLQYQASIQGTVEFSGADEADSELRLSIVTPPTKGTLTLLNATTGQFEYQPEDPDAWAGDSFTVQASDGDESSSIQTVTLEFTDDTEPNLTVSPSEGAATVALRTLLEIQSDDPIDLSSLTYINSDGACNGSVQLSADGFSNCIGIEQHSTASPTDIAFTLSHELTVDTPYTWRLSSDVSSVFGLAIRETNVNFTTTAQPLVISEVGASPYSNIMRWFEVYNAGSTPLAMADYELRSRAIDVTTISSPPLVTEDDRTFPFPDVTLQPGHYLVVRAQSDNPDTEAVDTEQVIHLRDVDWRPYWYNQGYLELIRTSDSRSIDFVTFGFDYAPTDSAAWSGTGVASLPFDIDSVGQSIGRDPTLSDTDSASDWVHYGWATVGGPNDVCGTEDVDEDGIPDCNEQPGSTFAGMPLYDWGASAGQPDIFLEIDHLDSTDEGVQPRQEALQKVVDAFALKGIAVHIDAGDLYDASPGLNPANFDLGGGETVPYALSVDMSPTGSQAGFYDYKADHFDYSRLAVFHYVLFSTSRNSDGSAGSSGVAELLGNDLMVSLGGWGLNSETVANTNALINFQASTLMHELGHNLALRHGGFENANGKPNYLSIMNYVYQLNGLPDVGNNEGDRYYAFYSLGDNCEGPLIDGPFADPANFRMDFSNGDSLGLDPFNLDETQGLRRTTSGNVDFNCNGTGTETTVDASATFSDFLATGSTMMQDHDDWSNLVMDFSGSTQGQDMGASRTLSFKQRQTNAILRYVGPANSDRGPVIAEPSPPAALLDRIRSRRAAP